MDLTQIKKGEHKSPETEFKEGMTPWNKGLKTAKFVTTTCPNCNKVNSVRVSDIKYKKGRFCSGECYKEYKQKNVVKRKCITCQLEFKTYRNYPAKFCSRFCADKETIKQQVYCAYCKKEFYVYPYLLRNKKGIFCSQVCQYKWQSDNWIKENHPNWKGGKPKCLDCNKQLGSYRAKRCKNCQMKNRWNKKETREKMINDILKGLLKRPTSYEKKAIEIIEKYKFPYKYVGDGSFLIGFKNPDFVNTNGEKKLVEIGNEFHHKDNYIEKRTQHFAEYGWETHILLDDNLTKKKILQFFLYITRE